MNMSKIGNSGIGKSTLLDLIAGIIKPTSGQIYFSGENIKDINISSWRNKVGIMLQKISLRMIALLLILHWVKT